MKLAYQTAIATFLLGTSIFVAYYFTSSAIVLFIGYGFIALALIVNILILFILVSKSKKDKNNSKAILTSIVVMLLNIPVMLCYSWFTMVLLNTIRITFTNFTDTTITDINIIGCEKEYINKLEIGESKTVWVAITGDCSININYLANKEKKYENVMSYVTGNMGRIMSCKIGVKSKFNL